MSAARQISPKGKSKKGRQRTIIKLPLSKPIFTIIQPKQAEKKASVFARQACGECAHLTTCWSPSVQNAHVEINLLVCRLQAGVDTKRTERRLLELWHPKLLSLTEYVCRKTRYLNRPEVLLQLQEKALTHARDAYKISAVGYPLYYLFGKRGAIFFAAQSLIRSSKKAATIAKTEIMSGPVSDEDANLTPAHEGSYTWDAEAETDISRGSDSFALLAAQAKSVLNLVEWRLYNVAVEWMHWRDVLPPFSALARVLRMDPKVVPELWAGVLKKLSALDFTFEAV